MSEPSAEQKGLAERLLRARKARGLTQVQLGEKAGVSGAYAAHLEGCLIANPSSNNLQKLAEALDVPRAWLAYGEGAEPDWTPTEAA